MKNSRSRYTDFARVWRFRSCNIKGIDFQVRTGEVFGLLGPNGAGKTTTVEILEGVRGRTAGDVTILNFDPDRQKQQLKDRIGVCLQATNLPEKITVKEALDVFAAFYTQTVNGDELLKRLQLWDKRNSGYGTLSGSQKQRLALALGLINDPQLLFLDEPTTGLDPQVPSRNPRSSRTTARRKAYDPDDHPLHRRSGKALRPGRDNGH